MLSRVSQSLCCIDQVDYSFFDNFSVDLMKPYIVHIMSVNFLSALQMDVDCSKSEASRDPVFR